ncbi:CHAP domain-containing protein [Epilithonimonas hungarica]|uniref:CHAP domain-containing protein n=1 Tax=Epilithonimonas hungarica TaxID=454006 RepID=A0A1G7VXX8_9FLAO|nr:CHAP domain-containing protein [Epilithonimonas hungarica]SDG64587.1 CHAP domain-containing protein [Epilithonimonas hungarica]
MLELRKQFIFYQQGCLKVSQLTTPEVIDNDVVPVVVEMAEAKKEKTCWCDRPFLETDIRSLVNHMRGKEEIWESTHMDRESFADLTIELNKMFSTYSINKCIQKIAFFANVYSETSFFRTAGEEKSDHASSGYKYKGRGIQQLTGDGSAPVAYKAYNEKVPEDIETYPELVATKLHLAVDSGGWFWSIYKKIPTWKENPRGNYSQAEKDAMKFKREYFSKALGKTLNEASLLMEDDEERYYYLICKILNGYTLSHKLEVDPNGWDARKTGLSKLKTWFKYDKNACKGEEIMVPQLAGGNAEWLEVAWQEYNTYKGYVEKETPLSERITEYFNLSKYSPAVHSEPWCATFIYWCFQHTKNFKDTNVKGNVGAFDWGEANNSKVGGDTGKDGWTNGEKSEPFVGAIIVFTFSHVAIIVGENNDGKKYVYLGGNQGSKKSGHQKICFGSISKNSNDIFFIMKPKKYTPSEDEKKLPKYDVDAENSAFSSR